MTEPDNPGYSDREKRNLKNYLSAKAAFNAKDLPACMCFYADDHQIKSQDLGPGREHIERLLSSMHDNWQDLSTVVENAIAKDDWVAGWCTTEGTHFKPLWGIAPTGRRIRSIFWEMHRFNEAGQIAETWNLVDGLTILQQLGAVPTADRNFR